MLGFFKVSKVIKVKSDNIFPVVGSLISSLSFLIIVLTFFSFRNHDQNGWGCDLVHKRSCCREHLDLDVNARSFFNKSTFLIELCSLLPLFHLFAYRSDVDDNIVVVDILCNAESSLDITHLDSSSCDTTVALGIMLLMVDIHAVIFFLALIQKSLLVQLLSLNGVSLVFNLRSELSAD